MPILLPVLVWATLVAGCVLLIVCALTPPLRRRMIAVVGWLAAMAVLVPPAFIVADWSRLPILGFLGMPFPENFDPGRFERTLLIASLLLAGLLAMVFSWAHLRLVRCVTESFFANYLASATMAMCLLTAWVTLTIFGLQGPIALVLLLLVWPAVLLARFCLRRAAEFRPLKAAKTERRASNLLPITPDSP